MTLLNMDSNKISPSTIENITLDTLRVSTMTITVFTTIGGIVIQKVYDALQVKKTTRVVKDKPVGENTGDIVSKSYAGKCEGLAAERKKAKKKPITETDHTHRGNKGTFGNAVDLSITDGDSNINIKIFCNGTLSCVGGTSVDQGLRILCTTYSILKSIDGALLHKPCEKRKNGKVYGIVELGVRIDMRNHNLTPTDPIDISRLIACTENIVSLGESLPFRIDYNNIINATLNATCTGSSITFNREHYQHVIIYWNLNKEEAKVRYKIMKDSSELSDSLMKPKDKRPIRFVIFPNGNSPIIFTGNSPETEMRLALEDFINLMKEYYNFPEKSEDNDVPEPDIRSIRKMHIHFI